MRNYNCVDILDEVRHKLVIFKSKTYPAFDETDCPIILLPKEYAEILVQQSPVCENQLNEGKFLGLKVKIENVSEAYITYL